MCGKVFCSKCVVDRVFDTDGKRIIDELMIKARQAEIKQKLRKVMICKECDVDFEVFLVGVKRMNDINLLLSQSGLAEDLEGS